MQYLFKMFRLTIQIRAFGSYPRRPCLSFGIRSHPNRKLSRIKVY